MSEDLRKDMAHRTALVYAVPDESMSLLFFFVDVDGVNSEAERAA